MELFAKILFEAVWTDKKIHEYRLPRSALIGDFAELWIKVMQDTNWNEKCLIPNDKAWIPKALDVLAALANCVHPDGKKPHYVNNMSWFFLISSMHLINDFEKKMSLPLIGVEDEAEYRAKSTLFWIMANSLSNMTAHVYIEKTLDVVLAAMTEITFSVPDAHLFIENLGKYLNMVLNVAENVCCRNGHHGGQFFWRRFEICYPDLAFFKIATHCNFVSERICEFVEYNITAGKFKSPKGPCPKSLTEDNFEDYFSHLTIIPVNSKDFEAKYPLSDRARLLFTVLLFMIVKLKLRANELSEKSRTALERIISYMATVKTDNKDALEFITSNIGDIKILFELEKPASDASNKDKVISDDEEVDDRKEEVASDEVVSNNDESVSKTLSEKRDVSNKDESVSKTSSKRRDVSNKESASNEYTSKNRFASTSKNKVVSKKGESTSKNKVATNEVVSKKKVTSKKDEKKRVAPKMDNNQCPVSKKKKMESTSKE